MLNWQKIKKNIWEFVFDFQPHKNEVILNENSQNFR